MMIEFDSKKFFFGGVDVPDDRRELVVAAQLRAFIDMVPAVTLAIFMISSILGLLNWGSNLWPVYFAFWYAMSVASFQLVRVWMDHNRNPQKLASLNGSQLIRRAALQAGLIGALWGLQIAFLVYDHSLVNLLLATSLSVGLLCIGVFALSVFPVASVLYSAGILTGFVGAAFFARENALIWGAPMFVGLALVLHRLTLWRHASFVEHVLGGKKLQETGEVISLLLRDFETHSSDWLWEIDQEGRLNRVSMRFAEAAQRPREALEGADFLDFFSDECTERLTELFDHQRSFREHISPVWVNNEKRWWSISARPRFDDGLFVGYRGVCSDVTQAQEAEARIAHMAHFDTLTGAANRAYFAAELDKAFEALRDTGEMFALHCIDLDDFKGVNDVHGHPAGDELLRTVVRRLRHSVGKDDLIGRQGGDEFVVLQRNISSHDDAFFLADVMCDALLEPVQLKGHRLLATGSLGSAIAPKDGDDAVTLLKHADLALYTAKKNGRGCSSFFEPNMDEEARRRSQIEQELRTALRTNELELHFQPLIEVETMKVKGYESLLRWRRANGEMIMPSEFIEIAETTGLIIPLGEWVIRTAIAEAAKWPDHVTVAINLSPIQMTNPSLISTVMTALASSGVTPARVEFEITESVLLEETEVNLKTLHALRSVGVKIALDDFGTGFSSLNYLRAFPFDKIKIDKCFVQEMQNREDCRAIISAVLSLANSLNMRTTAEGVENEFQMEMLRSQGCTEFQGFLFSTPIAAEKVPKKDLRADDLEQTGDMHILAQVTELKTIESAKATAQLTELKRALVAEK